MVKLIAIYAPPEDPADFRTKYLETHLPLAKKIPGLRKCELGWVTGSPMGQPRYHLVAELYFDSMEDLKAGLASPEGTAAGKNIMSFAGKIIHMMFATVE